MAQFGPGAVGIGWDLTILGLALHVADPDAPFDEAAWSAGPGGRRFITDSGNAWHAAVVSSGEDAAASRAATDRTIEFYAAN